MTQTDHLGVDAELPGKSLKWIRIAERKFAQQGLDLDNYKVIVFEEDESVGVILRALDRPKTTRGSGGSHPGYEVEINKKTKRIVRANYVR